VSSFSAEQYAWVTFLRKYKEISFGSTSDLSHDNIATSEKYFANNCILLSAQRAGIDWLKYSRAAYAQIPCLSNTGLYTFTDYKRMLNKYAMNKMIVIPNPFEEFAYFVVYHARFYIEKKSPRLHDFIRRLVNGKTHRKLDALKRASEQGARKP
jgi:hypothetical protein